MAFDDRHTELYFLGTVIAIAIALVLPALSAFGFRGWVLVLTAVGCGVGCAFLMILSFQLGNIIEWLRRKNRRDR
jgi:hypothetical protein